MSDHSTALALASLEDQTFSTSIVDEIADLSTDGDTVQDALSILIELPLTTLGTVPVDLPLAQTVTITIDDSGDITAASSVADQYTPGAAVIAGDSLSATGSLPTVTHSDCNAPERVYLDQDAVSSDNGYGTYEIESGGNWKYTLTTPPSLSSGQTAIDQFTVWSAGIGMILPNFSGLRYVDPRDLRDPDASPAAWQYPEDPEVPLNYHPRLGRVPGSDPDKVNLDSKLGPQRMLVYLYGFTPSGSDSECC